CQVGKSVVDVVGPVKGAAARAQTLLAIGHRGEAGQCRAEVDRRVQELQMHIKVRVADPVGGHSAAARAGAHEVNRYAQIYAKVLAEVVAGAGIELIDLAVSVRRAAEFRV